MWAKQFHELLISKKLNVLWPLQLFQSSFSTLEFAFVRKAKTKPLWALGARPWFLVAQRPHNWERSWWPRDHVTGNGAGGPHLLVSPHIHLLFPLRGSRDLDASLVFCPEVIIDCLADPCSISQREVGLGKGQRGVLVSQKEVEFTVAQTSEVS